jgi:hypothetical protein
MRRLVNACFVVLLLVLATPAGGDTHDQVGIGWWGSAPVNARYWFPESLQWCRDANQPYLVESQTTCTPSSVATDQLDEGLNRILGVGSRVVYVTLNANPRAFYMYTNPVLQPSVFVNPPEMRLRTAAAAPPYANLFTKGFTTFILHVFSNVPVGTNAQDDTACSYGTANCVERPHRFHSFGLAMSV